jgi:hypothetical protein
MRLTFQRFFVVVLWVVMGFKASGSTTELRVALLNFTTDDQSYTSEVSTTKLTSLIAAELQSETGVVWVERGEIESIAKEHDLLVSGLGNSSALKLGKWIKADILLTGKYFRNSHEGHMLYLEAIEVQRADVLASESIVIPGNFRDPISINGTFTHEVSERFKKLLTQAIEKRNLNQNKKVVAPLFFKNIDPSPRLNSYEEDLLSSFERESLASSETHVIRFPRATTAQSENELVLLGLVDTDLQAWEKVADTYVWGAFKELNPEDKSFEDVEIEVTINVWSGSGDPVQWVEKALVRDRAELSKKIGKRALEFAARGPVSGSSANARSTIAQWFKVRAKEFERTVKSFGKRETAFLASQEGKILWRFWMKTLETGCFFDPQDRELQWARFSKRWAIVPHYAHLPFYDQWQRARELHDFVEKFPKNARGSEDWITASEYVDSLSTLLQELTYKHRTPIDATEEALDKWGRQIEPKFANEAIAFAARYKMANKPEEANAFVYRQWLLTGLRHMKDPALAEKVIETFWPYFRRNDEKYSSISSHQRDEFEEALVKFYTKIGKMEKAGVLLSQNGSTSQLPEKELKRPTAQRVNSLSSNTPVAENKSEAEVISRSYPGQRTIMADVGLVTTMKAHEEQLWVAAKGISEYSKNPRSQLFRFSPVSEKSENLSQILGEHSQITSLNFMSGDLWMTLEFDGVWKMHLATNKIQKFGNAEGVLTQNMFAACLLKDRYYFGGTYERKGLLNLLKAPSMEWTRVDIPAESASKQNAWNQVMAPQVFKEIVAFKNWLVLGWKPWILYDQTSGRVKNLNQILNMPVPELLDQHRNTPDIRARKPTTEFQGSQLTTCSSDETGFWFGLRSGLCHFNPEGDQRRVWEISSSPIVHLAHDQEFLWVVCGEFEPDETSNPSTPITRFQKPNQQMEVFIFHKPSNRWITRFTVPSIVTEITFSRQNAYLALISSKGSIIEINKRFLGSIPQAQWKAATEKKP